MQYDEKRNPIHRILQCKTSRNARTKFEIDFKKNNPPEYPMIYQAGYTIL